MNAIINALDSIRAEVQRYRLETWRERWEHFWNGGAGTGPGGTGPF